MASSAHLVPGKPSKKGSSGRTNYHKQRARRSEFTTSALARRSGNPATALPPNSTTITSQAPTGSIWMPTSSEHPYACLQKSDEKRSSINAELTANDDLWYNEATFDHTSTSTSTPISHEFSSTSKFIDHYFSDPLFATSLKNSILGQDGNLGEFKAVSEWDKWPSPETTPSFNEDDVTEAFVKFVNAIIDRLKLGNTRVAVDRKHLPIRTRDGGWLKPDVFIWATGSGAYPPMEGKPSPKTQTTKKRAYDKPSEASDENPPAVDWPWCLMPIEVKTEKGRSPSENRLQLGTYVREVFAAQPNRCFIPSLLLTEVYFEFLLWDRAGVVISKRVNYHQYFDLLCLVVSSILIWEPSRVGFDPTINYPKVTPRIPPLMKIETEVQVGNVPGSIFTKVNYIVDEVLLRPYTISGRGDEPSRSTS